MAVSTKKEDMMNSATRPLDVVMRKSVWRRRFFFAVALLNVSPSIFASGDVMSLDAARAEHEAGRALLIDIREPDEHARGVARGARLMPMSQLRTDWRMIPKDPKQPVLLICNTQNRSSAVLKALKQEGYTNIRFVQGGMAEWARRGWPMVVPPGSLMSRPHHYLAVRVTYTPAQLSLVVTRLYQQH